MWRWLWPDERWRRLYHISVYAEIASLGVAIWLLNVVHASAVPTVVVVLLVAFLGPGWWLYRQAVIDFVEQSPDVPEGSGPEWPLIEGRLSVAERAMFRELGGPLGGDWVRQPAGRVAAWIRRLVARTGPREFRE